METIKRKYDKKITEGKITVKHYLNTKLKPVYNKKTVKDGKDRFPVYIQIGVVRQSLQIKSKILIPVAIDEFNSFELDNKLIINNEIRRITEIIKRQGPFNRKNFDIKIVSCVYNNSTIRLDIVIENRLKIEIQKLLLTNVDKALIDKYDALNERLIKNEYTQSDKFQSINIRLFSSTDWANLTSKKLIETFADYERSIEKDSLKGFIELQNKYWFLWDFKNEYEQFLSRHFSYFSIIEPTPIDWFESNFIQATIRDIYKKEDSLMGDICITQIEDLLTVNPEISWYVTE